MAGRSGGTRRSTLLRRDDGIGAFLRIWLRRVLIVIVLLAVVIWAGFWVFVSGADGYIGKYIIQKTLKATAYAGYSVENIMIEGRINADAAQIRAVIGLEKGDPIFRFDPAKTKESLERISWIKRARVERRLPATLYIRLEERKPFARWHVKNKMLLVDDTGFVLSEKIDKAFEGLMMIRGEGAPAHVRTLVEMLGGEPDLKSRIEFAVRVENRRWDLRLKNDKIIKLPEDDMGLAMSKLMADHRKQGILDKEGITMLDLRDPARLIMQAHVGKAQNVIEDQ